MRCDLLHVLERMPEPGHCPFGLTLLTRKLITNRESEPTGQGYERGRKLIGIQPYSGGVAGKDRRQDIRNLLLAGLAYVFAGIAGGNRFANKLTKYTHVNRIIVVAYRTFSSNAGWINHG